MLSTIGLTFTGSIGIGILMGLWLDGWLQSRGVQTKGFMVILFALFGIGAGFKQLIQTVIRANREQEAEDADDAAERRRQEPPR